VIAILLSNAFKYSPSGSEVRVMLRAQDHGALLAVTDHGHGIPAARLRELFRPFSRLGPEPLDGGTGLGLYICRGIVAAHRGRIWAESVEGPGSTFWVALPPGTP
jgi:signal transduction histidine kinase